MLSKLYFYECPYCQKKPEMETEWKEVEGYWRYRVILGCKKDNLFVRDGCLCSERNEYWVRDEIRQDWYDTNLRMQYDLKLQVNDKWNDMVRAMYNTLNSK